MFAYAGVQVTPGPSDSLQIRLVKQATDLKRFLRLPFASHYLYLSRHDPTQAQLLKLTDVPGDAAGSSVVLASAAPWSNKAQVRVRKGEKNEKELFVEVWGERGFVSSRKAPFAKIYNDVVFGGVAWSRDETKVVFVAEKPEPAAYKNYWEDKPQEDKKPAEEEAKKEDDKPQTYLDEKYKY